jgi:hypothetical protein
MAAMIGKKLTAQAIQERIEVGVPAAIAHLPMAEIVRNCQMTEYLINSRLRRLRRRREEERNEEAAAVPG